MNNQQKQKKNWEKEILRILASYNISYSDPEIMSGNHTVALIKITSFISQLLSELFSDLEECVGEDLKLSETVEAFGVYKYALNEVKKHELGYNQSKSEIKERISVIKKKWEL